MDRLMYYFTCPQCATEARFTPLTAEKVICSCCGEVYRASFLEGRGLVHDEKTAIENRKVNGVVAKLNR